jgi:hypothetical protein
MSRSSSRAVDDAIRACYRGNDPWPQTRDRVVAALGRLVPIDAVFAATADPDTLLFSSGWADDVLRPSGVAFLDNEYSSFHDVNRFADLAAAPRPIGTLDQATQGDWAVSTRWRTVMAPLGFGDELRVALRLPPATWGFLCLHREGASSFSRAEMAAVERVAPHAAEAIRRSLSTDAPAPVDEALVLVQDDVVIGCSTGAPDILEAIEGRSVGLGGPLPLVLRGVVRHLQAMDPPEDAPPARLDVAERSRADDGRPAATTIRTLEGAVLEVHATRMELSRDNGAVALTMLRPSAASLIGLRLASYGLTVAQRRVATLVLQGRSTREIMNLSGSASTRCRTT